MHAIRQLGAVVVCAVSFTCSQTLAQTQAAAVPASINRTDEAAIIASPRWRDLMTLLREVGFRGEVDETAMVAACHDGLATRSADFSAVDACLTSALWSWDSSSSYFPAAATARNRRDGNPGIIGIGAELERDAPHGPIRVVSPLTEGPGERAGLRPRDLIVGIDGRAVAPLTLEQAIARIRGPSGSVVRLEIERGSSRKRLSVQVTRERVHVVDVKRLPGTARVAVLRIIWISGSTVEDLAKRVGEILSATAPTPDTLVVDLRACRGGNLDAALQVGGAFSTDGTIVARELTRNGELALSAATSAEPHVEFPVAARQWLAHVRIAVLVDATTANDAEALAQFLREERGAQIFGQRTYGLAGVRTLLNIGEDVQVRIRTGRLISSRRVAWEDGGLKPDVALPASPPAVPASEFFGSDGDTALVLALRSLETPSGGAGAADGDRSGGGGEGGGGAGPKAE